MLCPIVSEYRQPIFLLYSLLQIIWGMERRIFKATVLRRPSLISVCCRSKYWPKPWNWAMYYYILSTESHWASYFSNRVFSLWILKNHFYWLIIYFQLCWPLFHPCLPVFTVIVICILGFLCHHLASIISVAHSPMDIENSSAMTELVLNWRGEWLLNFLLMQVLLTITQYWWPWVNDVSLQSPMKHNPDLLASSSYIILSNMPTSFETYLFFYHLEEKIRHFYFS